MRDPKETGRCAYLLVMKVELPQPGFVTKLINPPALKLPEFTTHITEVRVATGNLESDPVILQVNCNPQGLCIQENSMVIPATIEMVWIEDIYPAETLFLEGFKKVLRCFSCGTVIRSQSNAATILLLFLHIMSAFWQWQIALKLLSIPVCHHYCLLFWSLLDTTNVIRSSQINTSNGARNTSANPLYWHQNLCWIDMFISTENLSILTI